MIVMLLLKVASVACVFVGYRTWRWFCRRAHQGLPAEEQQASEEPPETQLCGHSQDSRGNAVRQSSACQDSEVSSADEASSVTEDLSSSGDLAAVPQEEQALLARPSSGTAQRQDSAKGRFCEDVSLRGFLSLRDRGQHPSTVSASKDGPELLFHSSTLPSSTSFSRPAEGAQPAFPPHLLSTTAPAASQEEPDSQESAELDAPWPGLTASVTVHEEEVTMRWPGLDVSQHSTTEAEAVVFRGGGGGGPAARHSPRWAAEEGSAGSPSPDSPLSLAQASPAKARRSKRGRGRTYFNSSSRSISSQESSPHAAAAATAAAASPFDHGLHTFVRSPRWADQQNTGAARAARSAQQSFFLQSSVGSMAGVHGSAMDGDVSPPVSTPARSPLLQHKADATANWVVAGSMFGGSQAPPLPSPFASADVPLRMPTTTDSSASPSATPSGRFGRMRTLSAPEGGRHMAAAAAVDARLQASPTKSGASGSPGEARLLSAQAAWAALGGHASPSRLSAVNSPREAFQSMESLEPAPTEEGFYLGGQIEKVLSELKEETQPLQLRRYSRSFSEPNLFQHFMKQMQGVDGEAANEETASSEEDNDEDPDGVLTRLQSAMLQEGEAGSEALEERRQSGAEASTADSSAHGGGANGCTPGTCGNGAGRADSLKRPREEIAAAPPAPIRLNITAGPSNGHSYTLAEGLTEVTVGRLGDNVVTVNDNEVSGHHAAICWEPSCRCWQVMDLGSLNGTTLNGRIISTSNRRRGRLWRLNDGDELQLGLHSGVKITYLPLAVTPRGLSLAPKPVLAPAKTLLTLPTLRSDALLALAQPPSAEQASHLLTAHAGLRLEAWLASCTGREHARMGQGTEDVGGCEEALLGAAQPAVLCTIYDGHCGRAAANEAAAALPGALAGRLRSAAAAAGLANGSGAGAAWDEAFHETDKALRAEEGCTATAVLAWLDAHGSVCLQAANVGDSAAFFARVPQRRNSAPAVVQLTGDHRYTNPLERERLAGMGIHMGANRTRLYGLNLSRCLGDKFLKDQDLGLSAAPHVSPVVTLEPAAAGIVVLASDGLWDVADGAAAIKVALAAHADSGGSAQAMAESLLAHAQKQRSKDDICVIAIRVAAAVAGTNAKGSSVCSRKANGSS